MGKASDSYRTRRFNGKSYMITVMIYSMLFALSFDSVACTRSRVMLLPQSPQELVLGSVGQFRDAGWGKRGLIVAADKGVFEYAIASRDEKFAVIAKRKIEDGAFDKVITFQSSDRLLLMNQSQTRVVVKSGDESRDVAMSTRLGSAGQLVDVCLSPNDETVFMLFRTSDRFDLRIDSASIASCKASSLRAEKVKAYAIAAGDDDCVIWAGQEEGRSILGHLNTKTGVSSQQDGNYSRLSYCSDSNSFVAEGDLYLAVLNSALKEEFKFRVPETLGKPSRIVWLCCACRNEEFVFFVLSLSEFAPPNRIENRIFRAPLRDAEAFERNFSWDRGVPVSAGNSVGRMLLTEDGKSVCVFGQSVDVSQVLHLDILSCDAIGR